MSKWRITRTAGIPESIAALGFSESIVVEAGAANIPMPSELEHGGGVARFGSFTIELQKGDKVEAVTDAE